MRVRVSYGADIEELPGIADELLQAAIKKMWNCVEAIERSSEELNDSDKNYLSTVSIINKARLKLNDVDLALSDISAILEGLDNYYNGESDVSERRPTVDSGGNTTDET